MSIIPGIGALAGANTMSVPDDMPNAAQKKKSDLLPRVLSALVLIPCALYALYSGGLVWTGLIAAAVAAISFEWADMVLGKGQNAAGKAGFVLVNVGLFASHVFFAPLVSIPLCLMFGFIAVVFGALKSSSKALWLGMGIAYIVIAGTALAWLRSHETPSGFLLVLFVLITVWASDIGAYFVGRSLGGPKIFPSISPNKTWSGSIGGVLIAAACAALFKTGFGLGGSFVGLCVAAMGLSCVSQAGDAFESAMKRTFNVKDSGALIPGHGGVFDRLDALLLAAPVMAAFIWLTL